MKTHKKKVIVIGHKNPDTDSICSAIAYTNFKNRTSDVLHVARCAGEINAETEFVLNYFNVEQPDYIDDVSTQVKDIDIHEVPPIDSNMSLRDAWALMRKDSLYTLPICSPDNHLQGVITNSDVAHVIMDLDHTNMLSASKTPYINILKTLNAELITGDIDGKCVETGKVVIADDNPDKMEEYIEAGDIVILGNRYESQLCAIEMEAKLLVVCEATKVTKTIIKLANSHGTVIMVSPYDTFTVARLINQSMPVEKFMTKENIIQFRTDAFIEEIKKVMAKRRTRDFPIYDHKNVYQGMISRRNLMDMSKKKLILVDHNEIDQAVDGIGDAEIIEIIDHHKLGNITTIVPMIFRSQPLGCTATIIYQIYKENNVEIDKITAGLMASAIISDTLLFKSPTCTPIDVNAANDLANIAGIDINDYAEKMFSAGSKLQNKTPEEIFYQDFKKFTVDDKVIGVGQINSISVSELNEIENKIRTYMSDNSSLGMDMIFFMLTDIKGCNTKLIIKGNKGKELINEAFNVNCEDSAAYLEGVVSRKKQFIPAIMVALQN